MKTQIIRFLCRAVIVAVLYGAFIFGAWVSGAEISFWAWVMGGFFVVGLPSVVALVEMGK